MVNDITGNFAYHNMSIFDVINLRYFLQVNILRSKLLIRYLSILLLYKLIKYVILIFLCRYMNELKLDKLLINRPIYIHSKLEKRK